MKHPLTFEGLNPIEKAFNGFEKIHHGSTIRLEHILTNARLHSHNVRPGFNDDKDINEVSAYGSNATLGDANDHFLIEIEGTKDANVPLQAIRQRFRLKHSQTGCYLASRDHKLPEWSFGQQEVTCSSKARYKLTLWRIEGASHPEMPAGVKKITYRHPGFFESFMELHQVMWDSNNNLKSSHPYGSSPITWPFMSRGISFWRATPDTKGIYLIGNPLVWMSGALCILACLLLEGVDLVLQQRNIVFNRSGYFKDMIAGYWFYTMGYLLHYFPFFLMGRQVRTEFNIVALLASLFTFSLL